jgi:hypothetical protein
MAHTDEREERLPPSLARAVREHRYLVSPRMLAEALLRVALLGRHPPRPDDARLSARRRRPREP